MQVKINRSLTKVKKNDFILKNKTEVEFDSG